MSDEPPAGWQPPPPSPPVSGISPAGDVPPPPGAPPVGCIPAGKPPRPAVPIAGSLMIVGALVIVVGTVLPWMKSPGFSANAWDVVVDVEDEDESSRGGGYTFFAVILAGFGITTIAARRLLPVAILAVIFGALVVIVSIGDLSDLYDLNDLLGIEVGIGPWVTLLGSAAALGGSIWTLCVRRRWPAAVHYPSSAPSVRPT